MRLTLCRLDGWRVGSHPIRPLNAGTVKTYRSWCLRLSRVLGGVQFFLVDYTLSPEVAYPVALRQCWKAYLWLLDPSVR